MVMKPKVIMNKYHVFNTDKELINIALAPSEEAVYRFFDRKKVELDRLELIEEDVDASFNYRVSGDHWDKGKT